VLEAVRVDAVIGPPWGVPALRKGFLLRRTAHNAGNGSEHLQAWRQALKVLQSFRQIDHGRVDYNSQSKWPETDAIRRAVTGGPWQHTARPAMPDYYPRADLGLPIVMHFIVKNGYARPEPSDRRIEGEEGRSRMASPIITKALPVDATQSVALIVVLDAPHVWDSQAPAVKLEPGGTVVRKNPQLNGATFSGPLTVGATTYTTAREAFRAYARSQGFTEVII
jgi:CRISPR/Cas system CMR-associated protein Cmr1 (group 7 of RAMP superfamily)